MCTIIIDMVRRSPPWFVLSYINKKTFLLQLDRILKLEEERPWSHYQLWTPVVRLFRWKLQQVALNVDDDGDDDPGQAFLNLSLKQNTTN